MSERRERSYDLKTFEPTRKIFKEREKEREMSTRQRDDTDGDDGKCGKIDGDSKKSNGWKSLKEMKEYLRSEFEKKTKTWQRKEGQGYLHFAAYLGDVDATKILLIEDKAEVNATDEEERTPMHFAAREGMLTLRKC